MAGGSVPSQSANEPHHVTPVTGAGSLHSQSSAANVSSSAMSREISFQP